MQSGGLGGWGKDKEEQKCGAGEIWKSLEYSTMWFRFYTIGKVYSQKF